MGVEPKIKDFTPKMDGENKGKILFRNGKFGGSPIFGNSQYMSLSLMSCKNSHKIRKIRKFLLLKKKTKTRPPKTGPRRCHTTGFDNAERIADMTSEAKARNPQLTLGDGTGVAKNLAPHLGVSNQK